MLYYVDQEHKKNLKSLIEKTNKIYSDGIVDNYYLVAYYVLCSSAEMRAKALKYINQDGIDFDGIRQQDFSSGYKILLDLAEELFNHGANASVSNITDRLDEDNFNLAIQAIKLKRESIKFTDL